MPTDLKKARELFLHAVGKLPPEQWDSYVAEACGADTELKEQLGRLLQIHREAGSFLNAPTPELDAAIEQPRHERPGTQIGPYKLLQQIGEGGMGVVYMAEQTEPVKRKVALKVIKAGMDSQQVIARFEAERQALAMMDHVNIARVLDAGTTESGRPYFVMELIHGVPITKYCDDHHLTPRERLELYVPVCQAIQHAHQKGIIHRDIKPSNVMVTLYDGKPVPKVIDFGVAKATEQKLTERTLFTQYGTMVGTLEYMSPEQAEMSAMGVDTRSDIYSLGVLLYELLTGSTPLSHKRMKEASYAEILRLIKEEEPPRPSTRLSESGGALASISAQRQMEPAELTKVVRGELDWIVMKCLEKDRDRRYETANSFIADVQRYLSDEPVQACPPTAWYRFRKFARRNRRALATAAAGVLVLVMAVVGLTVSNVRITEEEARTKQALVEAKVNLVAAHKQRERAEANFERAMYVVEKMLMRTSTEHLASVPKMEQVRQRLVEDAQALYQGFLDQESSDPEVRKQTGRVYLRMAEMYRHLGQPALAEEACRKGLDVARKLVTDFPNVPSYGAQLAAVHTTLGHFLRQMPGRRQEAEETIHQALLLQKKLADDFPRNTAYRLTLADNYHELGYLLWTCGRSQEAEEAYRQALQLQRELVAESPTNATFQSRLCHMLNSWGILLRADNRLGEAERVHREVLGILDCLPAEIKELARTHGHLALVLRQLGRAEDAENATRHALGFSQVEAAESPSVATYRQELALRHRQLAILLAATARPQEAEKAYRQALDVQKKLLEEFPGLTACRGHMAMTQNDLGNLLASTDRLREAEEFFQHAADGFREALRLEPGNPDALDPLARLLATCPLPQFRDAGRAVELAQQAVQQSPQVGTYWNTLGVACYRAGDWNASVAALEKSMQRRAGGDGFDWFFLAMAHLQLGDKEQARKWYDQAVEWLKKNKRKDEELKRFRAEAAQLLGLSDPIEK